MRKEGGGMDNVNYSKAVSVSCSIKYLQKGFFTERLDAQTRIMLPQLSSRAAMKRMVAPYHFYELRGGRKKLECHAFQIIRFIPSTIQ
jgi:hypothetical protein